MKSRDKSRSSRSQMFFKIDALKNCGSFTEKQLCWNIVLIKLHALRKNLHFSSGHPNYTKRSAAFSKTLRISTLGSNKSDFERKKEKGHGSSRENILKN